MTGIEDYLEFTAESGRDFPGGWLLTMDTSLNVGDLTVQMSSANEENSRIQILFQDVVRWLGNSSEERGRGEKWRIIDNYTQKLLNKGYDVLKSEGSW